MKITSGYQKAEVATGGAFAVLSIIAVALRFYGRRKGKLALLADDYIILVVLLICLGICVMNIWATVDIGAGDYVEALSQQHLGAYLQVTFALGVLSTLAIGLVKISVLLFYKRIFSTAKFRFLANALIGTSICWTVGFTTAFIVQYTPINNNRVAVIQPNHEQTLTFLKFLKLMIILASTDLLLDILTLSLPVPMIKGLHVPIKKKFAVGGFFALGTFCAVSSAVRLAYTVMLHGNWDPRRFLLDSSIADDLLAISLWSSIEPCASVVAACLPTLGPVFRARKLGGPSGRGQDSSNGSSSRVRTDQYFFFFSGRANASGGQQLQSIEEAQEMKLASQISSQTMTSNV